MTQTLLNRRLDGAVLSLAFNRPEKVNALNLEIVDELIAALRAAEHDRHIGCIVLSGEGRGFCSGQDLDVFRDRYRSGEAIDIAGHLRRTYNVVTLLLRRIEKPVIAAVNGVAAGVGLSLALACDLRIAAEDATFTVGFGRIGLVPDGGGSLLLPLTVGLGKALELAYLSERIDAREAHRIGLVQRVVEASALHSEAYALADRLLMMPASALALTKRAFNRALLPNLAAWLNEEADLQQLASENPDHREGVAAFLEKRSPAYAGRHA
jgi:2-(1,2-epoxy-1,2-dihydrophenyl)acetyl-CoA isomerase